MERNQLIEDNVRLVYYAAKKYQRNSPDWEDLVQAGMEGLCTAAARFDPEKGFAFSTYAVSYIKGHMNMYCARCCCGPVRPMRKADGSLVICGYAAGDAPICKDSRTTLLESLPLESDPVEAAERNILAGQALAWIQENVSERDYSIYLLWLGGRSQADAGRSFGLTQVSVGRIVHKVNRMLRDWFQQAG